MAIPVNTENTEPDNAEMTDPAEFPNSIPEKASPAATTSRENTENPDYNRDLDIVLFKCKDCEYSTYDERNLKQHLCKHTGEKPFKCLNCERRFAYWTQRDHHKCRKA